MQLPKFDILFHFFTQKSLEIIIMDKKNGFRFSFVGIIVIKMPKIQVLLQKKVKKYINQKFKHRIGIYFVSYYSRNVSHQKTGFYYKKS